MDLRKLFDDAPGSNRILPMEGVRGFAVLLVFFVHFNALFSRWLVSGGLSSRLWAFLSDIGHSGVDLFFVLSGYLIYGAVISKSTPYLTFMARRIQRIYPPFLAVYAIYVALSFAFPGESKIPQGLLPATLYLFENILLLPGIFDVTPMITVAWSLSYELFYYLLIPAVVIGLGLRSKAPKARAILFAILAAAYAAFCVLDIHPRLQLILFVSGILLFERVGARPKPVSGSGRSDAVGLAALLACFPVAHLPHAWFAKIILEFPALFLFLRACFTSTSLLGRLFSGRFIRYLGNMSYSYYLLHGLVLKFVALAVGRLVPQGANEALFWCLLPIAFCATLVGSAMLYALVEKPFSLPAVRKTPVPKAA